MAIAAIDYETFKIQKRPVYPPEPVGVAISFKGKHRYLAWGHPTENNSSRNEAERAVRKVQREATGVVYHNAPFDLEVQRVHLNIEPPPVFHDTQFLAYLIDPRQQELGLKPLADNWLDMPPDEQTALREWIEANVEIEAGHKWGAYIALAPGKLVGRYAKGDTLRTLKLFNLFYPRVKALGMLEAYERELKVARIKMKMETGGVRVALTKLKREVKAYETLREDLEKKIKRKLKVTKAVEENCPKGFFNLNSGKQLADRLEATGKVESFILTDKGNVSTSIDNLKKVCTDKQLINMLGVHSVLCTYLNTFIKPWIETASIGDGYIYPTFNQVRSYDDNRGGNTYGTKTGRPSSSNPNFNNLPASVKGSRNEAILLILQKWLKDYGVNFIGLRDYILPDKGGVLLDRDYSQQELRVLAHYEDGELLQRYLANPDLDVHDDNRLRIIDTNGVNYPRKSVKITGFRIIYGGGAKSLAGELEIPMDSARALKKAVLDAMPGVRELNKELIALGERDEQIRTWGGRLYSCEEPIIKDGRYMSFEYKLLNLLIQGSSADITKQAMINVDEACGNSRIMLQVYDQILCCTPKQHVKKEMALMREAMEAIKLDLPLPTDGAISGQSWARLKPYVD